MIKARPPEDSTDWHLDKRVPVAIILALLIQTAGMIWSAATLWGRVEALERRFQEQGDVVSRMTRIETKLDTNIEYIRRTLDEQRAWAHRLGDRIENNQRNKGP